jgi:hypothetical protein
MRRVEEKSDPPPMLPEVNVAEIKGEQGFLGGEWVRDIK